MPKVLHKGITDALGAAIAAAIMAQQSRAPRQLEDLDPAAHYTYENLEVQLLRYTAAHGLDEARRFIFEASKGGVLVHNFSESTLRAMHQALVEQLPRTIAAIRAERSRRMVRTTLRSIAKSKATRGTITTEGGE